MEIVSLIHLFITIQNLSIIYPDKGTPNNWLGITMKCASHWLNFSIEGLEGFGPSRYSTNLDFNIIQRESLNNIPLHVCGCLYSLRLPSLNAYHKSIFNNFQRVQRKKMCSYKNLKHHYWMLQGFKDKVSLYTIPLNEQFTWNRWCYLVCYILASEPTSI